MRRHISTPSVPATVAGKGARASERDGATERIRMHLICNRPREAVEELAKTRATPTVPPTHGAGTSAGHFHAATFGPLEDRSGDKLSKIVFTLLIADVLKLHPPPSPARRSLLRRPRVYTCGSRDAGSREIFTLKF